MTDYLKIYEKFKDVKEVKDYLDDVILLRQYYVSQQFGKMQGAKIIAEKVKDYAQRLNEGEKTFIESMIKLMK